MWDIIRKLFIRIIRQISLPKHKKRSLPPARKRNLVAEPSAIERSVVNEALQELSIETEQERNFIIEETELIEDQGEVKHDHEITIIEDGEPVADTADNVSVSPVLSTKMLESDETDNDDKAELIDVTPERINEEIVVIEDHLFGAFPGEIDDNLGDVVDENDGLIEIDFDDIEQVQVEEEAPGHVTSPVTVGTDSQLPDERIKKKSERKRRKKLFYFDIYPIPEIREEIIDDLIRLADAGILESEIGFDSQQMEVFLLTLLKRYELIGELPLGRKTFEFLCELIRKSYLKNSRLNITHVPPALFVVSMVFCARYSEEDARNFWDPYAHIVWKTESDQYFQSVNRKHFIDCRLFLEKHFDLVFPILNDGDVVRPVYYHAVIPYYLQPYFAEWLVDRFEQLLDFSIDDLPHVLRAEKSLDYAPPRLKIFLQQSETSDIAAQLIQQMAKAIRLFQTTEQFETVTSVMSSPIERSLWREIHQNLIEKQLKLEKIRKFTPKLEWVLDLDKSDIYLLLSQVRASKSEKPNLIVWAREGSLDLREEEVIMNVHPWQLSNGDWELEPEYITVKGDLAGKIFVLSEEFNFEQPLMNQFDHIILEKEIPGIKKNHMFFFIPSGKSTIREKDTITNDGNWIILSKEPIEIIDSSGQQSDFETLYIPPILREGGFAYSKKFSITLPCTLLTQNEEISILQPKITSVVNASLIGDKQINHLSPNVQPIFQSKNVQLRLDAEFTEHQFSRTWVSIHRAGEFVNSPSFSELQKKGALIVNGSCYFISLHEYINEPGSYSVNILHDLRLLIDESLQFAYLHDVKIDSPDPTKSYSPANPFKIVLSGVHENRIQTEIEEKVKIDQDGQEITILWKELRLPECRFSLQWEGNNIHFSWEINRVAAWIDGGGDKKIVVEGKEQNVVVNVRGAPKEEYVWYIKNTNQRRNNYLDSSGEYSSGLNQSLVRDLLKSSKLAQSNVAITIRDQTWDVFVYNKIPLIRFLSVSYKNGQLNISLIQSEKLDGNFSVQIRDKEQPIKPLIITKVNRLEDNSNYLVDLLPGKFQAEILLDDEILAVSEAFIVDEEIIQDLRVSDLDILIARDEKYTSQKLFACLTSDRQKILGININERATLIPILQQLIRINLRETWVSREKLSDGLKKLLPSWAVLQYPLRFHTLRHNKILHIFPQQVVYGGMAGKGYMSAKLDHGPVKIYAAWNTDFEQNKTYLWVMIPQAVGIVRFCELDEYDLWPGYECVDCGTIIGSRDGSYLKLSPQTTIFHRHNQTRPLGEQFIDMVYKSLVEVKVSQYTEKKLTHLFSPKDVVGHNYFNELVEGRMRSLRGDINMPLDTSTPADYYTAISEIHQNYMNKRSQTTLQHIVSKDNLFQDIKRFMEERKEDVPVFSALMRLDEGIVSRKILYTLPKKILLLSSIIRLKAYYPLVYQRLLERENVSENELMRLTFQAMNSCPKLLEWSVAWAEIFYNHTIS
jgi:hypothetical protein